MSIYQLGYAYVMTRTGHKETGSSLRIIAGSLKGRRIQFSGSGIRPTGDRVRETLFNWLNGRLVGVRCLDLFAGSGALGIEALSRGAAESVFVERQRPVAEQIKANLSELGCTGSRVVVADAFRSDPALFGVFDVVLLDPPFDSPGLADLCKLLETSGCLATDALVYIEVARKSGLPEMPANWQVLRDKTAGQVRFALMQRSCEKSQE